MPVQALTTAPAASTKLSSASFKTAHELADQLRSGSSCVLACEHNAEGVLTAIGLSYFAHADPQHIRLADLRHCQPQLFETVIEIKTDVDLAERVLSGFERSCGASCPHGRVGRCSSCTYQLCARRIPYACAADDPAMPDAVMRYIRLGFKVGARIRDMVAHKDVAAVDGLARFVSNECERTRQFARFSLMVDDTYFALWRPKADVVPFTASYFSARLGEHRWCMIDPIHHKAAFHEQGQRTQIVGLDDELCEQLSHRSDYAADEHYVRAMWKLFYDRVSLAGRSPQERGYDLRMQLMPKRLWAGLPELDEAYTKAGPAPERYAGMSSHKNTPAKAGVQPTLQEPHENNSCELTRTRSA